MSAMHIESVQHEEYLEVIITGHYDHEMSVDKFPRVMEMCRLAGINKALVDFTKLQGEIGATFKTLYAMKIKEHYTNHIASGGMPLKIAYLGSPSMVGPYEPGSEIARQENLPTKLTTDRNEALLWLGVTGTGRKALGRTTLSD